MKRKGISKGQVFQLLERDNAGQISKNGFANILSSLPAYDMLARMLNDSNYPGMIMSIIKDYQVSTLKSQFSDVPLSSMVISSLLRSLTLQEILGNRCDGFIRGHYLDKLKDAIVIFDEKYAKNLLPYQDEWMLEYFDLSVGLTMPVLDYKPHYLGRKLFDVFKDYSDFSWTRGFFLRRKHPYVERLNGEVDVEAIFDSYNKRYADVLNSMKAKLELISVDQALALIMLLSAENEKYLQAKAIQIPSSSRGSRCSNLQLIVSSSAVYISDYEYSDVLDCRGSLVGLCLEPVIPLL